MEKTEQIDRKRDERKGRERERERERERQRERERERERESERERERERERKREGESIKRAVQSIFMYMYLCDKPPPETWTNFSLYYLCCLGGFPHAVVQCCNATVSRKQTRWRICILSNENVDNAQRNARELVPTNPSLPARTKIYAFAEGWTTAQINLPQQPKEAPRTFHEPFLIIQHQIPREKSGKMLKRNEAGLLWSNPQNGLHLRKMKERMCISLSVDKALPFLHVTWVNV